MEPRRIIQTLVLLVVSAVYGFAGEASLCSHTGKLFIPGHVGGSACCKSGSKAGCKACCKPGIADCYQTLSHSLASAPAHAFDVPSPQIVGAAFPTEPLFLPSLSSASVTFSAEEAPPPRSAAFRAWLHIWVV